MQFGFGSGAAWAIDSGANPTPAPFSILQDAGVEFTRSVKELVGTYAFPVAIGVGTGKIACKAKNARMSGRLMNMFFGSTKASGQTSVAHDEAGTVPGSPYAITVANSATFVEDLGVYDAVTGIPLVRVASAPTTGQYSVAAGVYTFAAADTTDTVKISYTYTVAGTGEKITITNPVIGVATTFKSVLTQTFNSNRNTLTLNANVFTKFGWATKLEDFAMKDLDFSAFADSANNIGTWSLAETS